MLQSFHLDWSERGNLSFLKSAITHFNQKHWVSPLGGTRQPPITQAGGKRAVPARQKYLGPFLDLSFNHWRLQKPGCREAGSGSFSAPLTLFVLTCSLPLHPLHIQILFAPLRFRSRLPPAALALPFSDKTFIGSYTLHVKTCTQFGLKSLSFLFLLHLQWVQRISLMGCCVL